MSPGFSPLGRKHKKRTENASVEATGSQVSHASRRRHAQRSLIFDDGEASKVSSYNMISGQVNTCLMSLLPLLSVS